MSTSRIALLIAALSLAADAQAQAQPSGESLDALLRESVVRTASRVSERPSEVPSTVTSFTGDELLASGMHDVGEALAFLGVGMFVSSSRGYYYAQSDVGARGVGLRDLGRHVLYLVDGHAMNVPNAGGLGPQWLEIPLERIDHVEVSLGPGSVLYGSSAMIAVVHVYTRTPGQSLHVGAISEVDVSAPNERDHDIALPGGPSHAGLAFRTGAFVSTPVTIRNQDGAFDAYVEWREELGESIELAPRNDATVSLSLDGSPWGGTTSVDRRALRGAVSARVGRLTVRALGATDRMLDPLTGIFGSDVSDWDYRVGRIDVRHEALPTERVELTSRLFFDTHEIERRGAINRPAFCPSPDPTMPVPCLFRTDLRAMGFGFEEIASIDWDLDGRMLTTVGATGVARRIDIDLGSLYDLATRDPIAGVPRPNLEHTTLTGAIYVEQIVRPVRWFRLNIGGRLDADDQFGFHFSPRAAAIVRPTTRSTIRLSYSEAFRAPSYQEENEQHFNTQIPSGALRPEIVRDVELEWAGTYGRVGTSVVGFATGYRDLIAFRGVTMDEFDEAIARGWVSSSASPAFVRISDNLGSVTSFGGIGRIRADVTSRLSIIASGTGAYARTKSQSGPSNRLALSPAFVGNVRASYLVREGGTTLSLATLFMSRREAWIVTGRSSQEVPFSFDLRATASGPIGPSSGVSYRVGIGYAYPAVAPYSLGDGPTSTAPTDVPQLVPISGLHALVGLRYDVDRRRAQADR